MKKTLHVFLLIFVLSAIGCSKPCTHIDSDFDNICDKCGLKMENDQFILDKERYDSEFNARREYMFEYFKNYENMSSGKFGFGISAAYFKRYEETNDQDYLAKAIHLAELCWNDIIRSADCFKICYAVYHYGLFSNKYYSDELKEKAANFIKSTDVYAGTPSTTNHSLMFAVGCYLANQYFPGEIKTSYYGYDGADKDDPTAEKAIREVIRRYPTTAIYENNSDTYYPSHFFPLMAIADLSSDKELANKAKMIIHQSILQLAPIWLKGHTAVSKERCYQPYTAENEGGVGTTLLWYYLGGRDVFPTKKQLDDAESSYIGWALYSDFRPSYIANAISEDRSEVYDHYELHYYTKDRYETTYYSYMYTYMHKNYAVYTGKNNCSKPDLFVNRYRGFDRVLFGVDWVDDNPNQKSNFSISAWDDLVTDSHTKIGNNVYSDVLQNKGTVIGVFDMPEEYDSRYTDYTYPRYLTINLPTNYKAIIDDSINGKMYVYYDNIMIGFKISESFRYEAQDHIYIGSNKSGEYLNDYDGNITKAYFVCEVVDPNEIEGTTVLEKLMYFQSLLETSFRSIQYDYSSNTKLSYKAVDGTTMSLSCVGDGNPTNGNINGVDLKYDLVSYPFELNPWTSSKVADKVYTYNYKDNTIVFDYDEFKVVESIN